MIYFVSIWSKIIMFEAILSRFIQFDSNWSIMIQFDPCWFLNFLTCSNEAKWLTTLKDQQRKLFLESRAVGTGGVGMCPRVSSRFFDQPGHEILKRSIINRHLFINTYHPSRPQNLQQGHRSFPKLEFQKRIVLCIFDKNGFDTVILGPIDDFWTDNTI